MAIPAEKRCSQCGAVKPASAFASKGTRLHSACKACVKHQRQTEVIPDQMCHYCAQSFAAKRIDRSMGVGFFCSPEHRHGNRERQVMYTCAYCAKTFPDWPSRTGKGAFVTCSRPCKESYLAREQLAHFWDHVDQSSGPDACWPWTGGINKGRGGYGRFHLGSKTYRASRIAYILVHGPLTDREQALHSCDAPICCNPSHLFKGTPLDNVRDMIHKGRHPRMSLSRELARQIYALKGVALGKDVAAQFHVSRATVSAVWNKRIWLDIHPSSI